MLTAYSSDLRHNPRHHVRFVRDLTLLILDEYTSDHQRMTPMYYTKHWTYSTSIHSLETTENSQERYYQSGESGVDYLTEGNTGAILP